MKNLLILLFLCISLTGQAQISGTYKYYNTEFKTLNAYKVDYDTELVTWSKHLFVFHTDRVIWYMPQDASLREYNSITNPMYGYYRSMEIRKGIVLYTYDLEDGGLLIIDRECSMVSIFYDLRNGAYNKCIVFKNEL